MEEKSRHISRISREEAAGVSVQLSVWVPASLPVCLSDSSMSSEVTLCTQLTSHSLHVHVSGGWGLQGLQLVNSTDGNVQQWNEGEDIIVGYVLRHSMVTKGCIYMKLSLGCVLCQANMVTAKMHTVDPPGDF